MLGAELRFSAKSSMCFWWLAEIFPFEKGSHIFQTDLKLTLEGEGEGHLVWKLWDYRHAPPCWLYVVQRNELKALWMDFTELYPQPFILFLSHQCIIDKIYHSFSSELTHTTGFKKKIVTVFCLPFFLRLCLLFLSIHPLPDSCACACVRMNSFMPQEARKWHQFFGEFEILSVCVFHDWAANNFNCWAFSLTQMLFMYFILYLYFISLLKLIFKFIAWDFYVCI